MEHGLARQMAYSDGSDQSTKHYYAGTITNKKRKPGPLRGVKNKKKVVKRD